MNGLLDFNTSLQVFVFVAAEYETPKNSLNQVSSINTCSGFLILLLILFSCYDVVFQISLWDGIIPSKENAKFSIHTSNKYRFIDQVT